MQDKLLSLLLMVLVIALCFLLMAGLARLLRGGLLEALVVAATLVLGFLSIQQVDVNVPLAESHWRPAGGPAPPWAALLAWAGRMLPMCAVYILLRPRTVTKA